MKENNKDFLLSDVITVYIGKKDRKVLDAHLDKMNAQLIRINKLGYADIKLNKAKFFDELDAFLSTSQGEYAYDLNTYGELIEPDRSMASLEHYLRY